MKLTNFFQNTSNDQLNDDEACHAVEIDNLVVMAHSNSRAGHRCPTDAIWLLHIYPHPSLRNRHFFGLHQLGG